jgi:hypothetical protein
MQIRHKKLHDDVVSNSVSYFRRLDFEFPHKTGDSDTIFLCVFLQYELLN